VRDAGDRVAQIMASLTEVDREAIQRCVNQVLATLESLTPTERLSALDWAAAQEVVQ
jgi:hypothetical protein